MGEASTWAAVQGKYSSLDAIALMNTNFSVAKAFGSLYIMRERLVALIWPQTRQKAASVVLAQHWSDAITLKDLLL